MNIKIALVLILGAIAGILAAASNTIPYALVGMMVSKEESGLYIGILNIVQVSAQLLMNFFSGLLMTHYNSVGLGITVVGGSTAFIGIFLIFLMIIPKEHSTVVIVDDNSETAPLVPDVKVN